MTRLRIACPSELHAASRPSTSSVAASSEDFQTHAAEAQAFPSPQGGQVTASPARHASAKANRDGASTGSQRRTASLSPASRSSEEDSNEEGAPPPGEAGTGLTVRSGGFTGDASRWRGSEPQSPRRGATKDGSVFLGGGGSDRPLLPPPLFAFLQLALAPVLHLSLVFSLFPEVEMPHGDARLCSLVLDCCSAPGSRLVLRFIFLGAVAFDPTATTAPAAAAKRRSTARFSKLISSYVTPRGDATRSGNETGGAGGSTPEDATDGGLLIPSPSRATLPSPVPAPPGQPQPQSGLCLFPILSPPIRSRARVQIALRSRLQCVVFMQVQGERAGTALIDNTVGQVCNPTTGRSHPPSIRSFPNALSPFHFQDVARLVARAGAGCSRSRWRYPAGGIAAARPTPPHSREAPSHPPHQLSRPQRRRAAWRLTRARLQLGRRRLNLPLQPLARQQQGQLRRIGEQRLWPRSATQFLRLAKGRALRVLLAAFTAPFCRVSLSQPVFAIFTRSYLRSYPSIPPPSPPSLPPHSAQETQALPPPLPQRSRIARPLPPPPRVPPLSSTTTTSPPARPGAVSTTSVTSDSPAVPVATAAAGVPSLQVRSYGALFPESSPSAAPPALLAPPPAAIAVPPAALAVPLPAPASPGPPSPPSRGSSWDSWDPATPTPASAPSTPRGAAHAAEADLVKRLQQLPRLDLPAARAGAPGEIAAGAGVGSDPVAMAQTLRERLAKDGAATPATGTKPGTDKRDLSAGLMWRRTAGRLAARSEARLVVGTVEGALALVDMDAGHVAWMHPRAHGGVCASTGRWVGVGRAIVGQIVEGRGYFRRLLSRPTRVTSPYLVWSAHALIRTCRLKRLLEVPSVGDLVRADVGAAEFDGELWLSCRPFWTSCTCARRTGS